jgi:hypothetical protein
VSGEWAVIPGALIVAVWRLYDLGLVTRNKHQVTDEAGATVLSLLLLVFTAASFIYGFPRPAQIRVDPQPELGIDPLLFPVEGDSKKGIQRVILIQLYIALSNTANRKAIVSAITLEALLDAAGEPVGLAFGSKVERNTYTALTRWIDEDELVSGKYMAMTRDQIREEAPGPYVLLPSDAVTLRYRLVRPLDA